MKTKIYSSDVIKHLQSTIKSGNYTLNMVTTPDEMPKSVYSGGAKVHIDIDENTNRYVSFFYPDPSFTKNDMSVWRTYPIGKYYHKDWNAINKGVENYKKYGILTLTVEDVEIIALIRQIDKSEFETEDDYKSFSNLTINGNVYVIIKMYSPAIYESFVQISVLEETVFQPQIISTYGESIIKTSEDEVDLNEIPSEEAESVELF